MRYAHRVAYELAYGPIDGAADVMHLCNTPACVNPDHLASGSHLDNMRQWSRFRRGIVDPAPPISDETRAGRDRSTASYEDVDEHFWRRVDRSGDCWQWLGQRQRQGYGQIGWAGKRYAGLRTLARD